MQALSTLTEISSHFCVYDFYALYTNDKRMACTVLYCTFTLFLQSIHVDRILGSLEHQANEMLILPTFLIRETMYTHSALDMPRMHLGYAVCLIHCNYFFEVICRTLRLRQIPDAIYGFHISHSSPAL